METRTIGSLEVSVVGLGCNNFGMRIGRKETAAVVAAALDAGINFFDTADIYGGTKSETYLGAALGSRRDEIVLATKFGVPYEGHDGGASAAYVRTAVEDSLTRLGTDRIDLYQLHAPDQKTPIAETIGALAELVAQGKIREFGCSNFSAAMLAEAAAATPPGGPGFVSVQNQYNILHREPEDEVLAECDRLGLAFLPYFPLASGLLSGKYRAGEPPPGGHPPGRHGRPGGQPVDGRAAGPRRRPGRAGPAPRPRRARPRVRVAAVAACGRLGHRRRDHARAGRGERGGRAVAPRDRRAGRGRRDRAALDGRRGAAVYTPASLRAATARRPAARTGARWTSRL